MRGRGRYLTFIQSWLGQYLCQKANLKQTYWLKKDAVVYSRRSQESRGKHKFVTRICAEYDQTSTKSIDSAINGHLDLKDFKEKRDKWSVRQDLNLRPLVPKTSALPSCATHRLEEIFAKVVRKERLELSRREALEPKSSVSTNSTTSARKWGGRWDLNPRQPESQSGALPTELRPPQKFLFMTIFHSSFKVFLINSTMIF